MNEDSLLNQLAVAASAVVELSQKLRLAGVRNVGEQSPANEVYYQWEQALDAYFRLSKAA